MSELTKSAYSDDLKSQYFGQSYFDVSIKKWVTKELINGEPCEFVHENLHISRAMARREKFVKERMAKIFQQEQEMAERYEHINTVA